jgi:hypothetical protein
LEQKLQKRKEGLALMLEQQEREREINQDEERKLREQQFVNREVTDTRNRTELAQAKLNQARGAVYDELAARKQILDSKQYEAEIQKIKNETVPSLEERTEPKTRSIFDNNK